ncbi:MAG: hypothetical protein J6R39_04625, partial [Oscillospiraceae bacterium]|nr:hypothetical protein [Oscillospiraceae bacterium]
MFSKLTFGFFCSATKETRRRGGGTKTPTTICCEITVVTWFCGMVCFEVIHMFKGPKKIVSLGLPEECYDKIKELADDTYR